MVEAHVNPVPYFLQTEGVTHPVVLIGGVPVQRRLSVSVTTES